MPSAAARSICASASLRSTAAASASTASRDSRPITAAHSTHSRSSLASVRSRASIRCASVLGTRCSASAPSAVRSSSRRKSGCPPLRRWSVSISLRDGGSFATRARKDAISSAESAPSSSLRLAGAMRCRQSASAGSASGSSSRAIAITSTRVAYGVSPSRAAKPADARSARCRSSSTIASARDSASRSRTRAIRCSSRWHAVSGSTRSAPR